MFGCNKSKATPRAHVIYMLVLQIHGYRTRIHRYTQPHVIFLDIMLIPMTSV